VPGRRRRILASTAAVLSAVVAGCGISPDTAPRDIDLAGADADQRNTNPQAAIGEGEVFFVVQEGGVPSRLVAVSRDVDAAAERGDPTSVLDALLDGPNTAERSNEITTLLPVGLDALRVSTRPGGVVVVDLTEPFGELTGQTLVVALAQIVHTISEVGGVNGVRITVEGESRAWPDAIGTQQSDPLTVFDYPGLVRSTQPAFPAIPND
jgi:spore germination protein GerM